MELKLAEDGIKPARAGLLIVPYGIETSQATEAGNANLTFNCTLWN